MLLKQSPHIAQIDCAHCSVCVYDMSTGKPRLHAGEEIPRSQAPCVKDEDYCPKVRPGHSDLTDDNYRIFRDYLHSKSIDDWPDDVWSKRWRVIIQDIEQMVDQRDRDDYLARRIAGHMRSRR
jgi:hypothetical protein